jgi:hypothetical protein
VDTLKSLIDEIQSDGFKKIIMEIHELNRIKVNSENYIKNLEDYITNFKDETKISNNYCTTLSNETYYNKLKIEVIHFIYYELI